MTTEQKIDNSTKPLSTTTPEVELESGSEQKPIHNPKGAGRPKGSKNSLTILQEAAVNGVMTQVLEEFDKVVKTTIEKAKEGDTVCLKILWDRVIPARKAVEHIQNPGNQGITIVVQGSAGVKETETIEDGILIED